MTIQFEKQAVRSVQVIMENTVAKVTIIEIPSTEKLQDIVNALKPYFQSRCKDGGRIGLADPHGLGRSLNSLLSNAFQTIKIERINLGADLPVRRFNGPEATIFDVRFDAVIALCNSATLYSVVRYIHFCCLGSPPIVVLKLIANNQVDSTRRDVSVSLGSESPILGLFFPGAGTGRLSPVFIQLMKYYYRTYLELGACCFNRRFIDQCIDPDKKLKKPLFGGGIISQDTINKYYCDSINYLIEYQSYMFIHDPVSVQILGLMKGIRIVYLYRDPRDIINSIYHRLVYDGVEEDFNELREMPKEDALMHLLSGMDYVNTRRNYFLRWPSLSEMANDFMNIRDYSHIKGLRYEDIRYKPMEAYREMLRWLQLDAIDLIPPLTDVSLQQIIHSGTFEAQSGGQLREGDGSSNKILRGPGNAPTSLRKGVAGDWKNHFSPTVCKKVKETAGEALIALGYEENNDW